jgi:hypothetical protein
MTPAPDCAELCAVFDDDSLFVKTVVMDVAHVVNTRPVTDELP